MNTAFGLPASADRATAASGRGTLAFRMSTPLSLLCKITSSQFKGRKIASVFPKLDVMTYSRRLRKTDCTCQCTLGSSIHLPLRGIRWEMPRTDKREKDPESQSSNQCPPHYPLLSKQASGVSTIRLDPHTTHYAPSKLAEYLPSGKTDMYHFNYKATE